MSKPVIVVTSCTTRKRARGQPLVLTAPVPSSSLASLSREWHRRVARATQHLRAEELYSGRGMSEVRKAVRELRASLYVVSAGLGLVSGADLVPHYDLTVSADGGPIAEALRREQLPVAAWWNLLTANSVEQRRISNLLVSRPSATVLIALPAGYLRLVQDDLGVITSQASVERIRVFTSGAGLAAVPTQLRDAVMPYDARLEAIAGYAGTQSDFAQRALRHFATELKASGLPLDEARRRVEKALAGLQIPTIPTRRRLSDAEIANLLRQGWSRCGGSSTRLHRYLRDDLLVACEQSRFRELWRQVAHQLATEDGV